MPEIFGTIFAGGMNAAANIGSSIYSNQQAAEREKQARKENFILNEKAAANADLRTRMLYNDLYSIPAQMAQLKQAGLSPSVFFGNANGVSGQSGAQGSGAAGINPNIFGMTPIDAAMIAKTMAETDLIKEKKKTESGENGRGQLELSQVLSQIGLNNAATRTNTAQAEMQELQNDIANTNKKLTIERYKDECTSIKHNAQKAMLEVCLKYNEVQVSSETIQEQIQYYKERNANLFADTALKYSQKNLTEQEIKESETRIWTMIEQLNIEWANAMANDKNAETNAYWIENKVPYIEKELELEAQRLGIENKKIWIDGTTRLILGAGTLIQMNSKVGKLGEGGNLSKPIKDFSQGGKAFNNTERQLKFERRKQGYYE